MIYAIQCKLLPTVEDVFKFEHILYGCRRLYNYMLEKRINHYSWYKESFSKSEQENMLPFLKRTEEFSFLKDIPAHPLQDAIKRLDEAYKKFFRKEAGFPRFKSKDKYTSFTYKQTYEKMFIDKNTIYLPKIGNIKYCCHIEFEPKNVKTINIKKLKNGLWMMNITIDTATKEEKAEIKQLKKAKKYDEFIFNKNVDYLSKLKTPKIVAIDLGLIHYIATSEGETEEAPKFLRHSEKKLRMVQKAYSRKVKGSKNQRKAKSKLTKLHYKIACQRKDFLHKLSFRVVKQNDLIIVEDLSIKNMVENHKLAKSISDAGWGMFKRYLKYKAEKYNKVYEEVNPKGTSQTCICGAIVSKTLKERVHKCPVCGVVEDRDIMSAKVIKSRSEYIKYLVA